MDEKQFQSFARIATAMRAADPDRQEFWNAFLRGLRRAFHGEIFGTAEEHEKFLNCRDGEYRRDIQAGYRAGYYRDQLHLGDPQDVQPLRKLLGLSTADLAEIAGVSPRTVEGWEQGRPIAVPSLMLIRKYLMI